MGAKRGGACSAQPRRGVGGRLHAGLIWIKSVSLWRATIAG